MKTFDKLASIVGITAVIICLIAVYIMRGRSSTSQLASHLARKHQEDVFWLESDKSSVWYSVDVSKSNSDLQLKYVEMFEDEETKEFIKSSIAQADSWLLQTWYNIAKSIMSWFYLTQTDMNGYLQRGTMFVISTEQFKLLLSHANIHLDGNNGSKMIDLGAGDGNITINFKKMFQDIYATETSKPMQKLLSAKNITVLPIEEWGSKHKYDFISCLNLLDRCDNPRDIIEEMKNSLNSNGIILVALVLPFKPFVEVRNSRQPNQLLNIEGSTFVEQAQSFVELMKTFGFKLESWTRLPYLCEGDLLHSVYYLDDAVFLFKLL